MADKNKESMDAFRKLIHKGELTYKEAMDACAQSSISASFIRKDYETNVADRLSILVGMAEELLERAKNLENIINAKFIHARITQQGREDGQKD